MWHHDVIQIMNIDRHLLMEAVYNGVIPHQRLPTAAQALEEVLVPAVAEVVQVAVHVKLQSLKKLFSYYSAFVR